MKFGGKRIPLLAQIWTPMRPTIIKNKYLSEMEIDEIKLKVQSKCENRLPNVETNNNSSHSDQHPIIQPNGDIESQNTPPLQTYVNPEQASNNVQNGISPKELNIDPQPQHEPDEVNELKQRVLVEWIKVQNIEISEHNSLPKIRNTNKNKSTFSKTNLVVKNIIHEREPDLTSLNHLIYESAVISTELCDVQIKATKTNVLGKNAFRNK